MLIATCSLVTPCATRPGQRTSSGVRMPPRALSFMPLKGQALAKRSPPLSDVNTTMVSSARPLAFNASSTRPTFWSSGRDHLAIDGDVAAIEMHGAGERADAASSPGASHGQWAP